MSAVDFEQWAVPDLVLTLGGRTYTVPPPSVDAAKKILAAAVRGEIELGLLRTELSPEVRAEVLATLDRIEPGEHPALGPVYEQMSADGVPQATLDRMAYYAVFYWARGKAYADALAALLWMPRQVEADARPKGRSSSRRRTGRRTA